MMQMQIEILFDSLVGSLVLTDQILRAYTIICTYECFVSGWGAWGRGGSGRWQTQGGYSGVKRIGMTVGNPRKLP